MLSWNDSNTDQKCTGWIKISKFTTNFWFMNGTSLYIIECVHKLKTMVDE